LKRCSVAALQRCSVAALQPGPKQGSKFAQLGICTYHGQMHSIPPGTQQTKHEISFLPQRSAIVQGVCSRMLFMLKEYFKNNITLKGAKIGHDVSRNT